MGTEGSSFGAANGWEPTELYEERHLPQYVGVPTFLKLPLVSDAAEIARRGTDVAIIGLPIDDGVTNRPGARFGPQAIRAAGLTTGAYSLQLGVSPAEVLSIVDSGDANITPGNLDRSLAVAYQRVLEVAATGAIPIVLGGDHSAAWASATAVADTRHPQRLAMIHFDAHADTADETWGVPNSHATPMRRLLESGAIAPESLVQVGLRGYWPTPAEFDWMRDQGTRWHFMHEIEDDGIDAVVDRALEEALANADLVYLSIDIDVVDPGLAPGTGTPEPGGLLSGQLLRAIRRIVTSVELGGMDVMEVSPPYDHAQTTAMVAHRCVMEAISALAWKRHGGSPPRPRT